MTTRIVVEAGTDRQRVHLQPGLLRGQVTTNSADGCRIGLVATTALLLGGDAVELVVEVGPGATLDLFDVAGTVAYHGRGRSAAWYTQLTLAEGARLRYRGEPFVIADGADVTRTLVVEVAGSARCVLRETVVLGRAHETGGRLPDSDRCLPRRTPDLAGGAGPGPERAPRTCPACSAGIG